MQEGRGREGGREGGRERASESELVISKDKKLITCPFW